MTAVSISSGFGSHTPLFLWRFSLLTIPRACSKHIVDPRNVLLARVLQDTHSTPAQPSILAVFLAFPK